LAIHEHVKISRPDDHSRALTCQNFAHCLHTAELYFCRADLFANDEREGLPPEECLSALGLNPFDINERQHLINHIGCDAQFREGFYVSCWHLFREETSKMWKEYGDQGVAITSRYRLLKSALSTMGDRAYIGLVRYGSANLRGARWNLFRFITTKRVQYVSEQEVRAFLWIMDPLASINRHFDPNNRVHPLPLTPPPSYVQKGERRKVDLQSLLTSIVISPWACSKTADEISRLVKENGYMIPVKHSELSRYVGLLP
jgi:hypothetical protein